ncbi:MAG TPA: acyltransferase, partial [Fimbriimonadaceae bacterium]|nr:acyltransferase [Fimbriimonadaceae bacterium]
PAFYSYIAFIVVLVTAGLAIIVWPATLSAATFTWNYSHLWIKDPGRNVHLLGHFWTLAVEEQFYLLWPALLRRWTIPSAITWSTAIILVMPFARLANDLLIPSQRGYEGMMFHTAADTILCGCLAGIWYKHESPAWVRRLTEFKGIGVVCLLAALYVVPLISERVRGFGTTLGTWLDGVVVAILLLHLLQTRPKWAGVFEWQAVAWVGTLSYSLYLWQQAFTIEGPTKLPAPWNIGACLLAAIASFYLIEQPARKALRRRWQV